MQKKINYNKYKIKLITTIIIIVVLVMFLFIQIKNLKQNNELTYIIKQKSNYTVYIDENEFFNNNYLEKNQLYVSDMVDYIKLDFDYNLEADEEKQQEQIKNVKYNYNIIATLYIDYANTNQNLLKKDYEIVKDKYLEIGEENNKNSENEDKIPNKINIKENINIDYDIYNNEVLNFKERYNIPIKAYLKVYFIVDTSINIDTQSDLNQNIISEKTVSEVNINLSQSVFEIFENQSKTIEKTIKNEIKQSTTKIIITFILILIAISITYLIIELKQKIVKNEKRIKREVTKILKKYGDIIVELKEELDPNIITNAIEVKNFDQILDVEEEIREPILFYETKNKEAIFMIVDHKITYKYILK